MQGRDLLSLIQNEEEETLDFGISGFYNRSWSIRDHEWSYYLWLGMASAKTEKKPELYKYDPDYVPPKPSDYELGDQPEKENLIEEEPEIAKSLEEKMQNFIKNLTPSPGDLMAKDFLKRGMLRRG